MPSNFLSRYNGWLSRFGWLIPVLVALAVYSVALNNYFTYDDFIWLDRARTFKNNWRQIFRPDVVYFDPLVHLMFVADSLIGGLNHRWYHGVDLTIHAANSLLIYRFSRQLCNDDKVALYGGVLFASSFAIADAVLWSSSRVDLLSTFFSLGMLSSFLCYLRSDSKRTLFLSLLLFILALGAKGTPLVLPAILLWLIIAEKKPLSRTVSLLPFAAVAVIYIVLIKLTMHSAALPLDRLHFNFGNMALALCALFIPENTLGNLNLYFTASSLFIAVSASGLITASFKVNIMLRRTGYCILVVAILPVLILTDFKLATEYGNTYLLLVSPSHRIYLASVGAALLGGGVLRSIETFISKRFPGFAALAVTLLLSGIVLGNALLVRERDQLWEATGNEVRDAVTALLSCKQQVGEGSQFGLINFPGSRGFQTPMIKLYLGISDFTILKEVTVGMIYDQDVLRKAEKSFLFIMDNEGHFHDKSQLFRQQLQLNRAALLSPDHPEYTVQCRTASSRLAGEMERIMPGGQKR
jgi:hypothetical protein